VSSSARDGLLGLLLSTYPDLKRRLAARLGSSDLAGEALQDTYIRLRRSDNIGEIRNPRSYLFRMAINIASNRNRAEARHVSAADVEAQVEIPDEAPDPFRIAEARSELEAVQQALDKLPPRRRAIFRRAWVDGTTHDAIALEFGLAVRTVRHELLLATRELHQATQESAVAELQVRLAKVSTR
jgi:RNA polymerase sigma factor (sigma-70 family)